MKIGLRAGHSDNCTGAIGIVNEHEQMKKYYIALKEVFEQYGHIVIDCNSNGSNANAELNDGANKCNSANCDLFISLHMNCYNGQAHGTEVLVSSVNSTAYPYAQKLVDNFDELGFSNRGVKFEKLYEMNHINCGNIISEICFCDSEIDIDIYNRYSWEKLAYIFCNAIDSNIPTEPTIDNSKHYIVTNYLPKDADGYLDISYALSFFKDTKCYLKSDNKGIWIETQYLTLKQCNRLKETLGSWFYAIR